MKTNQLILGNNLEIIKQFPSNSIDCTITSPPYNKGEELNSGKIVKAIIYDEISDNIPEDQYQQQQIELIDEIYRVTKPGGHLFYNHKVRYLEGKSIFPVEWLLKTKWMINQEIIWDRKSPNNVRGWRYYVVDERIYWLCKPSEIPKKGENKKKRELKLKGIANESSIWRIDPERNNSHPAPFPVKLPKRILISLYPSSSNKLILDPYVGSGTTAIAAKELGHNYIGIDISKKYLKMAEERLLLSKEPVTEEFIEYYNNTESNDY
jgi:site-specific DNA-methyltransferase (adenine-specific)